MAGDTKNTLEKFERAADIFKGFSNPIRIRIIDTLRNKNLRVMELAEILGCSQPIISQQLKILKSAGIVHRVKTEKNYLYELTNKYFADIMKCMRGCLKM